MIKISIPGTSPLNLHHIVLDMNGTLTTDGLLPEGVHERLERLKNKLNIYMLTADTYGTASEVARELDIDQVTVSSTNGALDKANFVADLKPAGTIAIGNGYNDLEMFKQAQLSMAVIGREGCYMGTLLEADIVVNDINDALDMILNPLRIIATLRR
jgi:P-type E1-E2 ATPase